MRLKCAVCTELAHLLHVWTADPGPGSLPKQPESQNHKLKTVEEMGVFCFFFSLFVFVFQ